MPRVSVLIPVREPHDFLDEAIASCIAQTFLDWELVLVDDGASDSVWRISDRFPDQTIRVVPNNQQAGISNALNAGFRASRGEFIARLDTDDLMLPGRLMAQVDFLDQRPDVAAVGTFVELFGDASGVFQYPRKHDQIFLRMCFENSIAHPSVLVRRSALQQLDGPYRPRFDGLEDWDLWERLAGVGRLENLGISLTRYRVHAFQKSKFPPPNFEELSAEVRRRFHARVFPRSFIPFSLRSLFVTALLSWALSISKGWSFQEFSESVPFYKLGIVRLTTKIRTRLRKDLS